MMLLPRQVSTWCYLCDAATAYWWLPSVVVAVDVEWFFATEEVTVDVTEDVTVGVIVVVAVGRA